MIEVTEEYYIKPEDNTYTVMKKRYNSKKQAYEYSAMSYHGTFVEAAEKILKMQQCDKLQGKEITLSEAISILKETQEQVRKDLETYVGAFEHLK